VTANELMVLQPGQVFIHRNTANPVVATDTNVNASVQFAVQQLKIKEIVVCGHYECGGARAAMAPGGCPVEQLAPGTPDPVPVAPFLA
jgi:carbonic anhydrase